jgi:hypothetical protein
MRSVETSNSIHFILVSYLYKAYEDQIPPKNQENGLHKGDEDQIPSKN